MKTVWDDIGQRFRLGLVRDGLWIEREFRKAGIDVRDFEFPSPRKDADSESDVSVRGGTGLTGEQDSFVERGRTS